jgi:hypothetical protein
MTKSLDPRGMSEDDLLNIFKEIVAKPGPLTKFDLQDIATVDRELARRGERSIRSFAGAVGKRDATEVEAAALTFKGLAFQGIDLIT